CGYENTRRERLRGHIPIETVVPQAEVESGSSESPLVLGKQASGCRLLQEFKLRRPDLDRTWRSVANCVRDRMVDLFGVCIPAGAPKVVSLKREAGLQIM